ncbi:MAG: hypothetical protein WDN06_04480 [Asticcacaulis sp.]
MAEDTTPTALGDVAARQLANATKTTAQLSTITPRWLVHFLEWVPVEAGIFRLNKVKDESTIEGRLLGARRTHPAENLCRLRRKSARNPAQRRQWPWSRSIHVSRTFIASRIRRSPSTAPDHRKRSRSARKAN